MSFRLAAIQAMDDAFAEYGVAVERSLQSDAPTPELRCFGNGKITGSGSVIRNEFR
jgi:hypothetical protein